MSSEQPNLSLVTHVHITQNTKETERKVKIVRAGVVREVFRQEMEPDLGIDQWEEMDKQRVVREK